jgi:hypothetical protein
MERNKQASRNKTHKCLDAIKNVRIHKNSTEPDLLSTTT